MKANRTTRMYFKSFCGKATIDKHQLHRLALIIAVLSTQMRKCRTIDLRNMSFSRKLFGKPRQRMRTLPKHSDQCSGLLLWLSVVYLLSSSKRVAYCTWQRPTE